MVARRIVAGRLSLNVEFDLRQSLYTHLQRLSFGFYDRHQTGQLLSRATSDVSAVRMFLGYGLVFITQYGASLIAASALLFITSWQLALITFVLLPPIAIVATRYSRRSHPVLRDIQQRIADVTTQAEEDIVGVRVVKAFAQEDTETGRFAERTERVFERELDSARLQAPLPPPARPAAAARLRGDHPRRRAARDRRPSLEGRVLLLQPLPRHADLAAAHDRHVDRAVPARHRLGRAHLPAARRGCRHRRPRPPGAASLRRRRVALRGHHVRLRRRAARSARSRPGARSREHGRADRANRLGQDDTGLARAALLRPAGRPRAPRRRRRARPAPRRSARTDRDRGRGHVPVLGERRRQHRLRRSGRDARRTSSRRRARRRPTSSSRRCRTATTRSSASAA